ncbi:spore wall protein 25-like [Vairimorpha necatrix]|uniref:Spore wall protein 25-like n=1 Tax=Vairimorpha necatrix TaxID=6039 RepID=A0AAX4JIK2_9MICR
MLSLLLISLVSCSNFGDYRALNTDCCNRSKKSSYKEYSYDKPCHYSWNFERFVEKTIKTFRYDFTYTDYELLKCILYYIWECIGRKDKNKLALFVASSLHNTSYYKTFEERCSNDKYKSRGLLMIRGYENYAYLSELSCNDYIECPKLLAIPRYDTVCDTIKFWKEKLRGIYTFDNMMRSFRIQSWIENPNHLDIQNWRCMYEKLKWAYHEK